MSEQAATEQAATATSTEVSNQSATDAARPTETDWEAEARKWEKRSKDNFAKLKEAEPKLAEYAQMVEANKTVEQRQAEELTRWQTEAQSWRGAAVGSKIEALAAVDFADPSDAVGQLDPSKYLDAGGQIDEAAIKADLSALLERKPHWRVPATAAGARVPAPNKAQGSSATPSEADPASQFASILSGQLNRSS